MYAVREDCLILSKKKGRAKGRNRSGITLFV